MPPAFSTIRADSLHHHLLLAQVQRLRGRIYVQDGAIDRAYLSADFRHVQYVDDESWHLIVLDREKRVGGCVRYCPHKDGAPASALGVFDSALAHSDIWGDKLRRAIESDLECARRRHIEFLELGGWALSEQLRSTTEALRMTLSIYGFARMLGGALGIGTATTRHQSSSILRKIGGQSLTADGMELPPYYDPQYNCEMEVLRFDSAAPNPRYEGWIEECRAQLTTVLVVCDNSADQSWRTSFQRLRTAAAGEAERVPELIADVA
ncbi:MAG TPA: hypothetical protein VFL57_19250 [Bryobacteraceae bacterium]|nr:hypothetical protein [Bryobacteraceae bacterium]